MWKMLALIAPGKMKDTHINYTDALFIRNALKSLAQTEISQSALNAKKAGDKTTPASLHRNNQEWDRLMVFEN
jgi:hypothetical protein